MIKIPTHLNGSSARVRRAKHGLAALGALVLATGLFGAETVYQVRTFAGVMPGSADGPGAIARFNAPTGITLDTSGTIYVADTQNNTIRRITSGGMVSTIFGTPRDTGTVVKGPGALVLDAKGNFCVGQWPGVCKISPAGVALLQLPASGGFVPGVAVAADGTIYYADLLGNRIGKISPDGQPSTFAGAPDGTAGSADGAGTAARFKTPWGVAVGPDGTVYVADGGNYTIRRISPAGEVTTLAGAVGEQEPVNGTGSAAHFGFPQAIAIDADGNLFVGDSGVTIREVTPSGAVTTLAGDANEQGNVDGVGRAAYFSGIQGIAVTSDGILYVTDNSTIRRVTADGTVTTIAGAAVIGPTDGALDVARFSQPSGVTIASTGDIFVTGASNSLRRINGGEVSTLPASDVVVGNSGGPSSVAIAADGTIYAANSYDHTISKRPVNGSPILVAGMSGVKGSNDGVGAAASFTGPFGLALDSGGNLIVADAQSLRKVAPDGTATTLAGGGSTDGQPAVDGQGTDATFYGAYDVAIDPSGNIWVADSNYDGAAVRKVTPGGLVSTLAGGFNYSGDAADGTGAAAQFSGLQGIALAPSGNL
ncbi:MAG TPA: NHL repeat-containing protein [Opitutus sp.]|nr:NHL repeat-containing protein [Opitutus sp.]